MAAAPVAAAPEPAAIETEPVAEPRRARRCRANDRVRPAMETRNRRACRALAPVEAEQPVAETRRPCCPPSSSWPSPRRPPKREPPVAEPTDEAGCHGDGGTRPSRWSSPSPAAGRAQTLRSLLEAARLGDKIGAFEDEEIDDASGGAPRGRRMDLLREAGLKAGEGSA